MTAERQRALASLAVGTMMALWFALVLMIFFVPRLAAYWAQLATPLSFAQKLLLGLCSLAQHNFVAIAPGLLASTAAAFWWRTRTSKKMRTASQIP